MLNKNDTYTDVFHDRWTFSDSGKRAIYDMDEAEKKIWNLKYLLKIHYNDNRN